MARLALTSLKSRTTVPVMMTVTMTARSLIDESNIQMKNIDGADCSHNDRRGFERGIVGEIERGRGRGGVQNENILGSDVEYVDSVVERLCAMYTAAASRGRHIPFTPSLPLPLGCEKTATCSTTSSLSGLTVL